MEEVSELETRKIENPFNKHFQRHFHVNEYNDVVIKGIMPRMILSKKEQKKLMVEVGLLNIKKQLGEEPSLLEQLAISFLFDGTY